MLNFILILYPQKLRMASASHVEVCLFDNRKQSAADVV